MSYAATIKINFCGGIISPGDLYNILVAVDQPHENAATRTENRFKSTSSPHGNKLSCI